MGNVGRYVAVSIVITCSTQNSRDSLNILQGILPTATALIVRSQRSLADLCSIGAFSESASVLEEGRVAAGGPLLQQLPSRMSRDAVSQADEEDAHGFDAQLRLALHQAGMMTALTAVESHSS